MQCGRRRKIRTESQGRTSCNGWRSGGLRGWKMDGTPSGDCRTGPLGTWNHHDDWRIPSSSVRAGRVTDLNYRLLDRRACADYGVAVS